MKILLAGGWSYDIYEAALAEGFTKAGHEVMPFPWDGRLINAQGWRAAGATLQRRLRAGPMIKRINRALIEAAVSSSPDVVFVFRGDLILPATFRALRRRLPNTLLAAYNNDDPFSPGHPSHRFRHFRKALLEIDVAFAYRPANVEEFRAAGAAEVRLLPPWYVPTTDKPVAVSAEDEARFGCDVVFIGHYESDGRLEKLAAVADAGYRVRLFGTDWPTEDIPASLARSFPVRPVRSGDYRKALCAAKIALAFLSRTNRDCYTRRNFEIPATGTFMLSERTPELEALFAPGIHADYFGDGAELVEKVGRYLSNDEARRRIARAGRRHAAEAGYDVISRARAVLATLDAARARQAN